jgi:ABC-type antimicrobial peptide transport system permease subunit
MTADAEAATRIALETDRLAGFGLALGVSLALAGTGPLEGYLHGVRRGDVWGLLLATCVSAALALLAAWGPARRAMRVDLVAALRSE